jgi:hypothetical protein
MTFSENKSTAGDFDFLVGEWDGIQRRRKAWLADCDEWYEMKSVTRCWPVFGGAGNIDEVAFPEQGFTGLTVRLRDVATGDWSIFWANSRDGILGVPPVTGRFQNGVGLPDRGPCGRTAADRHCHSRRPLHDPVHLGHDRAA